MDVRVLLFASYADAVGAPELQVSLGEGATVSDLIAQLRTQFGASRLPPAPLVAVNQEYATPGTRIRERDEVAVIPPVAGG